MSIKQERLKYGALYKFACFSSSIMKKTKSLLVRMLYFFYNEENRNFIGGKTMYWKIVSYLALVVTIFAGILMLTPQVFLEKS